MDCLQQVVQNLRYVKDVVTAPSSFRMLVQVIYFEVVGKGFLILNTALEKVQGISMTQIIEKRFDDMNSM